MDLGLASWWYDRNFRNDFPPEKNLCWSLPGAAVGCCSVVEKVVVHSFLGLVLPYMLCELLLSAFA